MYIKILFDLYIDEKFWFVGKNEINNYKALQVIFCFYSFMTINSHSHAYIENNQKRYRQAHEILKSTTDKYNVCLIFVLTDSKDFLETLNFGIFLGKVAFMFRFFYYCG